MAGDRRPPRRSVGPHRRQRGEPLRQAALIGLRERGRGNRGEDSSEDSDGKRLHRAVKSSPMSAAGADWVSRPTET